MYRSTVLMTLVSGAGIANSEEKREELRLNTGYNFIDHEPLYPAETVLSVIEHIRQLKYPGWTLPEAYRALGRISQAAWLNTTVGKVTLSMLPWVNPEEVIKYLPSVFDRVRLFGRRNIQQVAPDRWIFNFSEEAMPADYLAGLVEATIGLVGNLEDYRVFTGPVINPQLTQLTIQIIKK